MKAKEVFVSWMFGLVTGAIAASSPAQALEVQVLPKEPQLGDTLSILIETEPGEATPTVVFGEQTYPVFAIAPNQYRGLLPTTPLDVPGRIELRVSGETEVRNLAVWVRDRSFPTQRLWISGGGPEATELELEQVAQFKTTVTPEKLWDGPFVRPSSGRVSTIYGVRRYYNGEFAQDYYHRGVDYAASLGSPVVAPAAGRVVLVGRETEGFRLHGNTIGIDHGQGVLSIFLHLNSIEVQAGDPVQAGQRIGTVGSTGISTGPHLHWGLYIHGAAVDPVPWRYEGIE